MDSRPIARAMRRARARASVSYVVLMVAAGSMTALGCTSDSTTSGGALTTEQATERVTATCVAANQRLSQLPQPSDVPGQAVWAGEIANVLDEQAADVHALVLLDEEQRIDVRAFADNTAAQAAAWRSLSELLGSEADLTADPRVGELTTEIAELSLGRDDLSDELGVAECRRG